MLRKGIRGQVMRLPFFLLAFLVTMTVLLLVDGDRT